MPSTLDRIHSVACAQRASSKDAVLRGPKPSFLVPIAPAQKPRVPLKKIVSTIIEYVALAHDLPFATLSQQNGPINTLHAREARYEAMVLAREFTSEPSRLLAFYFRVTPNVITVAAEEVYSTARANPTFARNLQMMREQLAAILAFPPVVPSRGLAGRS